jgi:hypothetical protein
MALLMVGCASTFSSQKSKEVPEAGLNLFNRDWKPGCNFVKLSRTDGTLKVEVESGSKRERWPNIEFKPEKPEDWTRFHTLHLRVKLTSTRSSDMEDGKNLAFCFYDRTYRNEMKNDVRQQVAYLSIPRGGDWFDLRVPLEGISRKEINWFYILMYEGSIPEKYSYTYEFQRIELEGTSSNCLIFDGEALLEPESPKPGKTVCRVATRGGLTLGLDATGAVAELNVNGANRIGQGAMSGILVRDAIAGGDPQMLGGSVLEADGCVFQNAAPEGLGLSVETRYEPLPGMINITGHIKNLTDKDRALTVYFALPLSNENWVWSRNMLSKVAASEIAAMMSQEDAQDKWPLGLASLPEKAAVALGIRLDEPQQFRIGFNAGKRTLFIARDIALVNVKTTDGKSLNEAEFSFILQSCNPAWGYRSALENYYKAFPQFFVRRTNPNGAWTMYRNLRKFSDEQIRSMGGRFSWGTGTKTDELLRCRKNGVHNLQYIEAEYVQISMADCKVPGNQEVKARLEKLAAADETELQKVHKLHYHKNESSELTNNQAKAVQASCLFDQDGKPVYGVNGQRTWIGDNNVGIMAECNLSPGIPDGRGQMTLNMAKKHAKQFIIEHGFPLSGVALDCFGWTKSSDFEPAHFPYAPCALTFDPISRKPCLPVIFTSACWLKELAGWAHGKGMFTFANLGMASRMTFMAPYMDIFAKEVPLAPEPDYLRMLAYQRSVTFNPYNVKVPPKEIFFHILYAIYPGDTWQDMEIYERVVPVLDILNYEGWQPVTGAIAEKDCIRLERYGEDCLVAHNLNDKTESKVVIKLDKSVFDQDFELVEKLFTGLSGKGGTLEIANGQFTVDFEARDTLVLRLTKKQDDSK